MDEIRELLRVLALAEPRAAVACVVRCARWVQNQVDDGDWLVEDALSVAEAWTDHTGPSESCEDVLEHFRDSAADAPPEGSAAYHVLEAARTATEAVGSERAGALVVESLDHAVAALAFGEGIPREWGEATMAGIVRSEGWERETPTTSEVLAARRGVAVAWDALGPEAGSDEEISVFALAEAYLRAVRLSLDWSNPVERGLAERLAPEDEALIRTLLEGGATRCRG